MANRNQYANGSYTGSGHIKIAREFGLRSRHRLISVSRRYIICMEYGSVSPKASMFI